MVFDMETQSALAIFTYTTVFFHGWIALLFGVGLVRRLVS